MQLKWSNATCVLMSSKDLSKDVRGAEEMLSQHMEVKMEIEAMDEK